MSKIIFTNEDGGVTVVNPSTGTATDELATVVVPAGVSYEIVDDSTIPSDETFFDAWEWAGIGSPIIENLAKVQIEALKLLKTEAARSALFSQKSELLYEANAYSTTEIRDAYLACKTDIQDATVVSMAQQCLNTFTTTYGV